MDTVKSAGNESITLPVAPVKTDYEFKGWYLDENVWSEPFTADYFADKATTEDVYVYARYDLIEYTVTFETYGGSAIEPFVGTVIEKEPYTQKDGCDFEGWYLDSGFNERVEFPYIVKNNCTLYANWTLKTATFLLDEDNMICGIDGVPENGKLIIPSTVNGIKVNGIADDAFRENNDIVSVEIDKDIVTLGTYAFAYCKNLQTVSLPESLTSLPSFIFMGCTSLKGIELPLSVKVIHDGAFRYSELTEISLPDSLVVIGQGAFKNCVNLNSVNIPASMETIK